MYGIEIKHGVVRIDLHYYGEGEIDIVGNAALEQPRIFCVSALPELLQERLNVLKMLSEGESIPNFGRKYTNSLFHVRLSNSEWNSIQPFLIKENVYEKKYKLRHTYSLDKTIRSEEAG